MNMFKTLTFCFIITFFMAVPIFAKERVAIMDFHAKDVEQSDALAVSDLFRSDMVATGLFIVLERSNMESILSEHELQMSGITNTSNAAEIGELLSVNYLFMGNLSKFGSKYILVIDRINVETGEIEQSVKKTAVNIDSFLELSAEAAGEMSGSDELVISNKDGLVPYESTTLTQMFSDLGIFELSSLEIETKKMQTTDVPLRRSIYDTQKKDLATISAGLNLVSFGIAGSFVQGFNEYAYLCIGTTGFFAASLLFTENSVLIGSSAVLFGLSWLGSLGVPFFFEAAYNKNLKEKLLVF